MTKLYPLLVAPAYAALGELEQVAMPSPILSEVNQLSRRGGTASRGGTTLIPGYDLGQRTERLLEIRRIRAQCAEVQAAIAWRQYRLSLRARTEP